MEFERRAKKIDEELTALKTAHIKSAGEVGVTFVRTTATLDLRIRILGVVDSVQIAYFKAISRDGEDMLASCTVDNLELTGERAVDIARCSTTKGEATFAVRITSGTIDDYNTLIGGGSVRVTVPLTITATSECWGELAYGSNI